jgi:hypothetical protein
VTGFLSTDQFALSSTPNSTQVATNVNFLLVNSASQLTNLAADGLIGLAPNVPTGASYSTLLQQFNAQSLLKTNMFSLQLGFNNTQSSLWLGGYSTTLARSMLLNQYSADLLQNTTDEGLSDLIAWAPSIKSNYWSS